MKTYNDHNADALDRELACYEPPDDVPEHVWLEDAREYEAAALVLAEDEWQLFAGKGGA